MARPAKSKDAASQPKAANGVVPRKRAAAAGTVSKAAPAKKPAPRGRARKAADLEPPQDEGTSDASEQEMQVDVKDASDPTEPERPSKKAKVDQHPPTKSEPKKYVAPVPKARNIKVIRERSTARLDVYVFGKGDMCELGLGPNAKARTVTRPRLNPFLLMDPVGVVEVAVGGMHTAVLTHDGRILTWGVNDQNALGRSTTWEAPEVDIDKAGGDAGDDDDSEDDAEINPLESAPGPVEGLPAAVNIVGIACSDSLTLAITDTGFVYAWGTFRVTFPIHSIFYPSNMMLTGTPVQCSDGILGFSEDQRIATHPFLLPNLKNIIEISAGVDHILALSSTGTVFAWGNGQQYQLGRRVIERTRMNGLVPREFGLKKIVAIGAGSYHSFAVDVNGRVWAWGLNQYGQCGIDLEGKTGEDGVAVPKPTIVKSLSKYKIVQITGGEHHSAAVTDDGKLLTWGRLDANQLGIKPEDFSSEFTVYDEHGKPRFITEPTVVPGLPPIVKVACGTHHNIALDQNGKAYSWGFGENFQVGQGPAGEDILTPTLIDNTAVRNEILTFAGCGGQFSVLAGHPAVSKQQAESIVLNGKDGQANGTK
ncbi:Alsin [Drechslerella dactyloides]|uniref:Alsin n=1 Tax=Drechslerella dactyloides TaxID=74499 RepID=A0AAD6NFG1_DREDA|nr:Alsin [Drechslerella dactyloides]